LLSSLVEGVYTFRLTVTDDDAATDSETVTVTVNPLVQLPNQRPVANAGANITITLPTTTATLNGGQSSDPDGTISSYNWTRISGTGTMTMTTPNNVTAMVYGLSKGVHVFRLTVKDNRGAQASDEVSVTVQEPVNQKPIAQAGPDLTIYVPDSKAILNGGASSDPDGLIIKYAWKQLTGPKTAIQMSPASAENEVSELAPGAYTFELAVTDNRNDVSKDTVTLTVINNFRYEEKLVASPNPALNSFKLTIYSDTNGPGVITVRDAYGRIIKQIKRDKNQPIEEEYIYVNDLKSGLYYIDYTIEKSKRMVTRLIKH
ncbi:MAG: PKD domain-containing protein, partial [Flavitalea sp.]